MTTIRPTRQFVIGGAVCRAWVRSTAWRRRIVGSVRGWDAVATRISAHRPPAVPLFSLPQLARRRGPKAVKSRPSAARYSGTHGTRWRADVGKRGTGVFGVNYAVTSSLSLDWFRDAPSPPLAMCAKLYSHCYGGNALGSGRSRAAQPGRLLSTGSGQRQLQRRLPGGTPRPLPVPQLFIPFLSCRLSPAEERLLEMGRGGTASPCGAEGATASASR